MESTRNFPPADAGKQSEYSIEGDSALSLILSIIMGSVIPSFIGVLLASLLFLPVVPAFVLVLPSKLIASSHGRSRRGSSSTTAGEVLVGTSCLNLGVCRAPTLSLQATGGEDHASDGGGVPREQDRREAQQPGRSSATPQGQQLNIACNDVVRTILRGNGDEDAKALRQRLEQQRSALVSPDDEMSALFFDNLLLVCDHELHPNVDQLRGEYGRAWKNILHYIEDAGWQMTDPPFTVTG